MAAVRGLIERLCPNLPMRRLLLMGAPAAVVASMKHGATQVYRGAIHYGASWGEISMVTRCGQGSLKQIL